MKAEQIEQLLYLHSGKNITYVVAEIWSLLQKEKERYMSRKKLSDLSIDRVVNGYILTMPCEYQAEHDDELDTRTIVIEDDENDDLMSAQNLLHAVMDCFCLYGSKHDKEQLTITRRKNNE